MAKGVGLDAGAFEVKVVELDGSYRKPRLTKVSIDRVPVAELADAGEEGRARLEAEAALHALKDAHVSSDGATLGFPSREAVMRNMVVPFEGEDSIRKVIKFEAEGEIHSHSVDDMIVDFRVVEEMEGETRVLVAAVPKRPLTSLLSALESLGIEPEQVDLDTMALYRVADWAGCFDEDEEDDEDEDGDDLPATTESALSTQGATARIVVDVGARSTRVIATVDGDIVDMRALRVGADTVAEEIRGRHGVDLGAARDLVAGVDLSEIEIPEPPPPPEPTAVSEDADDDEFIVEDVDEEPAPMTPAIVPMSQEDIDLAREAFLRRFRREIMRFLASLPRVGNVDAVYLTGSGSRLVGIVEVLEDVFGTEVAELDVLSRLSHDLDDEEVEDLNPRLAVAVGLALGELGGPKRFNFRQEELAYRRKFDRVKFPLAIACMLGMFLLFILYVRQDQRLTELGRIYGATYGEPKESAGGRAGTGIKAEFWGMVRQAMAEATVNVEPKDKESLVRQLVATDTFKRMPVIFGKLQQYVRKKREETGVYEDLQLPSGVYVLNWFGQIVQGMEKQLGSFLVRDIRMQMPHEAKNRKLIFGLAVRGDAYRQRLEVVKDGFRAYFDREDCPFSAVEEQGNEKLFVGEGGSGAYYQLELTIKERYSEGGDDN